MYTYEQRMTAVNLYIKYYQAATVILTIIQISNAAIQPLNVEADCGAVDDWSDL